MYITFQDYSKLNDWLNKYQSENKAVLDLIVTCSVEWCRIHIIFKVEDDFILHADLYIGDINPFSMYNYNKFKEDMDLIISQKIMESKVF